MISKYPEMDKKRVVVSLLLLLLLIAMPIFLLDYPVLIEANATIDTSTLSEDISNAVTGQIAPVLLVPIAISGNNVYVAWPSNTTGHLEITFRASSDNGKTFADKINLSNTQGVDSTDPQIAASGNYVYVSWWEDYGNGTRVPFFRTSNDNGHTFGLALSLSDTGPMPVLANNDSNNSIINNAS